MAEAFLLFFFFKQKTAYEMRISDWSSDVCSSDLAFGCVLALAPGLHHERVVDRHAGHLDALGAELVEMLDEAGQVLLGTGGGERAGDGEKDHLLAVEPADRKSVVERRSVSVRVDLGGRRSSKKKKKKTKKEK